MSTVLKRVFANPRVTPGVIVVLVIAALLIVPRVADSVADARAQREFERARHWTPEPWALTATDFGGHDTEEIAVEPGWMTDRRGPGWNVDPLRPTGLAPLFHDLGWFGTRPGADGQQVMAATDAVAGVRVDDVEVYTYVSVPWGRSYSESQEAADVWYLQEDAARVADYLVGPKTDWPEPHEILAVGYVGDRIDLLKIPYLNDRPFDGGDTGYFGVTTLQRTSGEEYRTTTIATVVEGSLAVVGVVVPDGVEPDADLEPALLLERLAAEVRAAPPSHTAPGEEDDEGAQAPSRTTSGAGNVMAAGS